MSRWTSSLRTMSMLFAVGIVLHGVVWAQDNPPVPDFNTWRSSSAAADLNNDGKIDEADFKLFVDSQPQPPQPGDPNQQPQPDPLPDFNAWQSSSDAKDLNNDGKIDEADFRIFVDSQPQPGQPGDPNQQPQPGPLPDFNAWQNSPDAKDLNNDGKIDEADFRIFVDSQPRPGDPNQPGQPGPLPDFTTWRNGPDAKDLNNDGQVDEVDFKIFVDNQPVEPFPPGTGGGDAGLPPDVVVILDAVRAQLESGGIAGVDVSSLLGQLPDPGFQELLKGIAGDDGLLTLDDILAVLGGHDGPFPDEPPIAAGKVIDIDREGGAFKIEAEDGAVEVILLVEDTQFFFGGPVVTGDPSGPPIDDPSAGGGFSNFGQLNQPGPGGQPGQPGQPGQHPGDPFDPTLNNGQGGAPVGFGDLNIGDYVEIYGERVEGGEIVAHFIGILPAFEPGIPGGENLGEPVAVGTVEEVDYDTGVFTLKVEDGTIETVQVNEATQFFIRFQGDPFGPPVEQPGQPGSGFGSPTGFGNTSTFGQFGQPGAGDPQTGQPGQPGVKDPSGAPQGEPAFEGIGLFEDLQPGDEVEVFGTRDEDIILAVAVKINRAFDQDEFGFPLAVGRVRNLDADQRAFEVEEGPGFLTRVTTDDKTEFLIEVHDFQPGPVDSGNPNGGPGGPDNSGGFGGNPSGPNGGTFGQTAVNQPGGDPFGQPNPDQFGPQNLPEQIPASFEDLKEDDDVDVFGSFQDDGSVLASKVVIFRGPEDEEPAAVGNVLEVFADGGLRVLDEEADVEWTVTSNDETEVTMIFGGLPGQEEDFFGSGQPNFGPEAPGGPNFKPAATKQQPFDPNAGNQGPNPDGGFEPGPVGGPFGELRAFEEIETGMTVAVFGEADKEAKTIVATRISMLFGGARTRPFEVADRVDFFDQFGGFLNFQPPPLVFVQPPLSITFPDGGVSASLTDLRKYVADQQFVSPDPNALRLLVDLLPTPDPNRLETNTVRVLKADEEVTPSESQLLITVFDPWGQVRDWEGVIQPPGRPGIRITRNTEIVYADGSPAGPEDLNFGVRVRVTGTETVYPGAYDGERVAARIEVIGGEPFFVDALVAAVDAANRTIALEADPPAEINNRAFIGDTRGRNTPLDKFADELAQNVDLEILAQFNPYGPGLIRLELVDPRSPRPFRPEDIIFPASEVSIDVENRVLLFNPKPPISVPEGTPIFDDNGQARTLADLDGNRVILDGEVIAGTPTALNITVLESVGFIRLETEVGDFDGEGAVNDARLRVFKGDSEEELTVPITAFLDFFPPTEVKSGAVANNLQPGQHFVSVEVPSVPGLYAEMEFVIRDRKSALNVVSTTPEEGDKGVAEGKTTVSIEFSSPIQVAGRFVNVTAFLQPAVGSGQLRNWTLSEDGKTVSAAVTLDPGVTYTLRVVGAVSTNRSALNEPVTVTFSTGDQLTALATIRGKIDLAALTPAASKQATEDLEILFGEVIAVDSDGDVAGQAGVDSSGVYEVKVPEGSYKLFAKIETNKGPTSGRLDDVSVTAGEVVEAPTFTVAPPKLKSSEPAQLVSDTGEDSPIKMDLDTASGNQGLTALSAAPGDVLNLAVYIEGVKDLAGYELQVQYDSTAVALEGVSDDGDGGTNILKQNGGFAAGLATPRGNVIIQAAAILGPTSDQLGQGDGLLGVFTFRVSERFFGTTELVATQLLLSADTGASDTIRAFARTQIEVEGLTRQIKVTSNRDTLSADGSDEAKLTVKLYDLDGIAYSKDDTSKVTFEITSSNGAVVGGKSYVATVSGGQTTATVKATGEGDITVLTSLQGARPVQTVLTVPSAPAIGEGAVGPIALDLKTDESGDQGLRITPETPNAGDTVVVELVATEGASGLAGYQVTLTYDPTQLSFSSQGGFSVAGLFTGAVPIVTPREGVVQAAVAFLGATSSASDAGTLGTFTFTVAEGFTAPTRVTLVSGQYGSSSGQTKLTIGPGGAAVQIGATGATEEPTEPGTPSPDLNGDGKVDFPDFLIFAGAFGSKEGDSGFVAAADLNGSGTVDFPDFLTFAGSFGKTVGEKPASRAKPIGAVPGVNGDAVISLVPVASGQPDEALVAVRLADVIDVQGYGLSLAFDAEALELVDVMGPAGSLFGADGVAIQTFPEAGEAHLADILAPEASIQGSEDLVLLRFRVLDTQLPGQIDLVEALVSDGNQQLNALVGAHLADVRGLPEDYVLSQNYPNPFNPETVLPFALPVAGDVHVAIYNVLGQEVVTLVDDHRPAGFYRLVWNGKDHLGRATASGIYFVRMVSGEFTSVRKMLLLK